ncbi:hypothetical protein TUM4442_01580 [Shewanella algae]|nr:hypothetical protein TUM4442_01580 [Shewanella algae]
MSLKTEITLNKHDVVLFELHFLHFNSQIVNHFMDQIRKFVTKTVKQQKN